MNDVFVNRAQEADTPGPGAVYLAPRGFEAVLAEEITRKGHTLLFCRDRLLGALEAPFNAIWADNIWLEPRFIAVKSISHAAAQLKSLQRNWALFSTHEHRRAALIQEALPSVSAKPLRFGEKAPSSPLGSWTLWSKDRILASPRCSSPFPHGEALFVEDKEGPPNRAYLKLWELFTRIGVIPGPGDLCLDLGSAPGGWTFVLAQLGARVFSVDKAPLAAHVARHTLVEHCSGSAFALEPAIVGDCAWVFCDVACYPHRLLAFIRRWLTAGCNANFVCTLKFAGKTDFDTLEQFMDIPNSTVLHLFNNKHEVTWLRLAKEFRL